VRRVPLWWCRARASARRLGRGAYASAATLRGRGGVPARAAVGGRHAVVVGARRDARSRKLDLRDHELGGLGPLAPWSLIRVQRHRRASVHSLRKVVTIRAVVTMLVRLMSVTMSARHLRVDRRPVAVAGSVMVW
jgi:hypothetical protein